MCFKEEYPQKRPEVTCKTPIFHPNIDPFEDRNNVYVSLLNPGDWTETTTLQDLIQALLFLMHNPDFDCPLASPTLFMYHEEGEERLVDGNLYETYAKEIYQERKNPLWKPDSPFSKDFFEPAFNKGTREEWQRVGN